MSEREQGVPANRRRADMDELLSAFEASAGGAWVCRAPAILHAQSGPIRFTPGAAFAPGALFMGVDVATLLSNYRRSGLAPVAWRGQRLRGASPGGAPGA